MKSFHIEKDKLRLWSVVCIISAAPSFYWVLYVLANIPAMITGVVLFILAYTIATSSNFYKKIEQKSLLFKSLKWGFRVRVFYSIVCLFTVFLKDLGILINIADWYLGLLSINITNFLLGENSFSIKESFDYTEKTFLPTLFTTITQGILLSLVVFALSLIFWLFFRAKIVIFSRHPVGGEAAAQDLNE